MERKKLLLVIALVFIFNFSFVFAEDFGYNLIKTQFNNNTAFVNESAHWVTPSLGVLSDVNASQFSNNGGVLNALKSWWDGLYCELAGCTMEGNIDMNGNDVIDVNDITQTGNLTISGSQSQQGISVGTSNPFGLSRYDVINSAGSKTSFAVLGPNIPQVEINNYTFGGNASGIVSFDTNPGHNLFLATSGNNSIIFGNTQDGNTTSLNFTMSINPFNGALSFQGDKVIVPVRVDGAQSLFRISDTQAAEGLVTYCDMASDDSGNFYMQKCQQIGKNESAGFEMNSQMDLPKEYLFIPTDLSANITNNPRSEITGNSLNDYLNNKTSCLEYEEWLQDNKSILDEGFGQGCDTAGRGVPHRIMGDADVARNLRVGESAEFFNIFNFVARDPTDFNIIFDNGPQTGKLDVRTPWIDVAVQEGIDLVICSFNLGLSPCFSESIAPEVGRDWIDVADPGFCGAGLNESCCFDDNCAQARGGVEKVLVLANETTTDGFNITFSFYASTLFAGADNMVVEVDDNLGNVTILDTINGVNSLGLYSYELPDLYENKSTYVTTRAYFNGQNANRYAFLDEVRVQANFSEPILTPFNRDDALMQLGKCLFNVSHEFGNATLDITGCDNLLWNGVEINGTGGGAGGGDISGTLTSGFVPVASGTKTIADSNLKSNALGTESLVNFTAPFINSTGGLNVIGATTLQGDINSGGNGITNVSYINVSNISSQNFLLSAPTKPGNSISNEWFGIHERPYLNFYANQSGINSTGILNSRFNAMVISHQVSSGASIIYLNPGSTSDATSATLSIGRGTNSPLLTTFMKGDFTNTPTAIINQTEGSLILGVSSYTYPTETLDVRGTTYLGGNVDVMGTIDLGSMQISSGPNVISGGVDFDMASVNGVLGLTAETLVLGDDINSGTGLSSGDANISTLYYDSLSAKSPHVFEPDHEVNYTRMCVKDAVGVWNMIWWDRGVIETETNSQRCNDKMNPIEISRENQRICLSNNYSYDRQGCYEMVKYSATRSEVLETYQKEIVELVNVTYERFDRDFNIVEVTEEEEQGTGTYEDASRIKEGCGLERGFGLYCEVREAR